jgi:hypothetical protein
MSEKVDINILLERLDRLITTLETLSVGEIT